MNLIVCICAVVLIAVKDIKGLKTSKFLSGIVDVKKVCAGNYRVFTRVGVSSAIECAFVCSEASGCDAIFFSAVHGSCSGCRKLNNLSSGLVASTANVYYQLVNDNFSDWHHGTSRYFLDVTIQMNYTDAKVYCQLFGAHVVIPDSQDEQNFLKDRLSETPTDVSKVWIGITDANDTNTFLVEHSGEKVNYESWGQEKPNHATHGHEPCATLVRNDGWDWHDWWLSDMYNVVCERD